MARRRRRRTDGEGGEDSILDDDDDDLDIRVTSIEEELQNLLLSTQEQIRDQRTVRAKVDKLAREFEEDAEGDDELFQELDQQKKALEQLRESHQIVAQRLGEMAERLANVAGQGALESLPGRMDELVNRLYQQVQQRFESLEAAREEENDLVATRLEELTHSLESQTQKLRQELQASLQDQSKLQALSEDVRRQLEGLHRELEGKLAEQGNRVQTAVQDSQDLLNAFQQEVQATLGELADALDSRAALEDISELRSELESLQATFSNQSEIGARAQTAAAKVDQLEATLQSNVERYEQLLQRSQQLSSETEKYSDKVDLAVRLVRALEEKGRGGSPAELGAPVSVSSVSEADLEAPEITELRFGLRDLLNVMNSNQASDLHIKVGSTPMVRLHGELIPVGNNSLGEEDCRRLIFSALSKEERRRLLQQRSLDFLYEQPGVRLRGHAFYQRNRLCASLKMLRSQMPSLEDLGLPAVLRRTLSSVKTGVILVTGPLGAGKSTTLAALVDELNRTRKMHILTLESPLTFIHQDQQSLITQRECPGDFRDSVQAIHDGLKHDPDVLVVDPADDPITCLTALAAGDSGHLVLLSLTAPNLLSALDRVFHHVQGHAHLCDRRQVAHNIRAVVSQRLLPRADRKGLVPAAEVLLVNSHISTLLAENHLDQLSQAVQNRQAGEGSQTMSQSLTKLMEAGMLSDTEAASLLPAAGDEDAPIMQWL